MLIWLAHVKDSHHFSGPAHSRCTFLLSYTAWLVVCSTLCRCFSWAISWLFFKWPLSQGMAGQHMETSALTIFLSKQQMALLLSFWSGAKIPKAEVLVYIDCLARNCLRVQFASPDSSAAYRCLLCNSHSSFVSSCDSAFVGHHELWFFLLWPLLSHCINNCCPHRVSHLWVWGYQQGESSMYI